MWKGGAWYRGWLLGGPSEEKKPRTEHLYTFFCLDYGFETRAPLSHVTHLPDDCHGIAPQVGERERGREREGERERGGGEREGGREKRRDRKSDFIFYRLLLAS